MALSVERCDVAALKDSCALQLAAGCGERHMVEFLLQVDADVEDMPAQLGDIREPGPFTALYEAVQGQHVEMSDGEDAELLVYLVDEEMDIYIGVLAVALPPCQPGTAQLDPSATSVSPNLYELANGGHSMANIEQEKQRKKDLDTLPYIPDVRQTPKRV